MKRKFFTFQQVMLAFVFLLTLSFTSTAQETLTITMWDSYGDGWNGGTINADVNGTVTNITHTDAGLTSTLSGPEAVPFVVPAGATVDFGFTTGSFLTEVSFLIEDEDGNVIAAIGTQAGGPTASAAFMASFTAEAAIVDPALSCNFQINVSLSDVCDAIITPEMVTTGGPYANPLDVELFYDMDMTQPVGLNATNDLVDGSLINQTIVVSVSNGDNACWGNLLIEDKIDPTITCPPNTNQKPFVDAQEFTVSSVGGANFARPVGSGTTCSTTTGDDHPYVAMEFTISAAGMYTFTMADNLNVDSYLLLYSGSFDAANPCDNWLAGDDDDGPGNESELEITLSMAPGNYVLVSTTFFSNVEAEYAYTVFGDGEITSTDGTVITTSQIAAPAGSGEFICTDVESLYTPDLTVLEDGVELPSGNPTVADNCSIASVTYSDVLNDGGQCEDDVIVRTFTATDLAGNTAECTQQITIRKPTLDDIVDPAAIVLNCDDYASADALTPAALAAAGITGAYPTAAGCFGTNNLAQTWCNIGATYVDATPIDLCGGGFKVVRSWTYFDWCSGDTELHTQILKVEDTDAPELTCAADFEVGTSSPYVCTAEVAIPVPGISENCSNPVLIVVNTPEGDITLDLDDPQTLTLGVGTYVLTYTGTDLCGNVSETCTTEITVTDAWGPVAICDQNTTVSLDENGWAEICAPTFNDGSYDACAEVTVKVKRMDASSSTPFTDCIQVSCSDIEDGVLVRMRVYDLEGNFTELDPNGRFNECMINVTVQDKLPPVITCPKKVRLKLMILKKMT